MDIHEGGDGRTACIIKVVSDVGWVTESGMPKLSQATDGKKGWKEWFAVE
jgi:hypothetical protein